MLFHLVFSRDTDISFSDTSFRRKTIYKTSQRGVINSLYVQDLKKAMEVFLSHEECTNCKLGVNVWICLKRNTCVRFRLHRAECPSTLSGIRDHPMSYISFCHLLLLHSSWLSALFPNSTEISMTLYCLDQVFHISDLFFKGQLPLFFWGGGRLY